LLVETVGRKVSGTWNRQNEIETLTRIKTRKGIQRMRITRVLALCSILTIAATSALIANAQAPQAAAPAGPGMTLMSPAYEDGGIIPPKYTQAVPNFVSIPLKWTYVPDGVVSFVLMLHDPDASINKTTEDVLHWMAFNIPGATRELPEGLPTTPTLPDGTIQIKNRRGAVGFLGPGMAAAGPYHHYTFELWGLDTKLTLGPDATRDDVFKAMQGHIVTKAVLAGRFHR
jgi:Raf kinase inhibitor-like YbhB/YbcL family protein